MFIPRVHIIGLGKSGQAAAKLLLKHNWHVVGSDHAKSVEPADVFQEMTEAGVEIFVDGHDRALEFEYDLAVVSPGISLDSDVVQETLRRGIPVIGELELGWRNASGRIAAVTGSNGKTTTTELIGSIFRESEKPSFVCGNVGLPISDISELTDDESLLALEVSSFQLESIKYFKPDVSVVLNISPDHLDRHKTIESYAMAKSRIWLNQKSEDWVVYFGDDDRLSYLINTARAKCVAFSLEDELSEGAFYADDTLVVRHPDGGEFSIDRSDLKIPGRHNIANALAAMTASYLLGIDPEIIRRGIKAFTGVPHRLESIRELNGVTWINDSKATNVDAGLSALAAMDRPVIWIAGGRAKGGDFSEMRNGNIDLVKHLILIGEAAKSIERDLSGLIPMEHASDMEEAVKRAADYAETGDAVLLSPLCASFDMFKNFEDRGDTFRRLVGELE